MDFPVTRRVVSKLDEWIAAFAAPHLPARRHPEPGGEFRWVFREESPETLLVGKGVRMVTSIRAALQLAGSGFTTECGVLLRVASETSQEILAVCEGLLEGRFKEPQKRFVKQYFAPLARTPEELEEQERERYVSRAELFKAHYRLAATTAAEAERLRMVSRYLDYAYDKYVHTAYVTSMELYTGDGHRFMLAGHESKRHRCYTMVAVVGKLHEVLTALEFMALTKKDEGLHASIRESRHELEASEEQSGSRCH